MIFNCTYRNGVQVGEGRVREGEGRGREREGEGEGKVYRHIFIDG